MRAGICIAAAAALFFFNGCGSTNELRIEYSLEPGHPYPLAIRSVLTVTEEIEGQRESSERSSVREFTFIPAMKTSGGAYVGRLVIENLGGLSDTGAAEADRDNPASTDVTDAGNAPEDAEADDGQPDTDPPTDGSDPDAGMDEAGSAVPHLSSLRGKSYTLSLESDGTVTALEGWDVIADSLFSTGGETNPEAQEMMRQILSVELADAVIRILAESVLPIHPRTPVTTGDTWRRESVVDAIVVFPFSDMYSLERAEGDSLVLTLHGSPASSEEVLDLESEVPLSLTNIHGSKQGSYVLDRASGWIRSADIRFVISGEIPPAALGDLEAKNAAELTFIGRITVTGGQGGNRDEARK